MTWNQKHMIQWWYKSPGTYVSKATHQLSDGYRKRGRWNKVSRVSNAKQRFKIGWRWVTKRYSRWNNVG